MVGSNAVQPAATDEARAALKQFWDVHGDEWDRTYGHGSHSHADRNRWISVLSDMPAARLVLDVGAGSGYTSLLLADLGHYVTALDWSEERLAAARRNADIAGIDLNYQLAQADALPYGLKAFNTIVCRHALWSLPDPLAAMREWRRIITPTGKVIVDLWLPDRRDAEMFAEIADVLPLRDVTDPDAVVGLLEEAGFTNVDIERWPPDDLGRVTVLIQARPLVE